MARTTDNYTTHGTSTTETTKPETTPETKPEVEAAAPETKPEETLDFKFTGAELRGVLKLVPPVDNRTDDDPVKSAREKLVAAVEKLDAAKPKETPAAS